jgi:hypothetical protein
MGSRHTASPAARCCAPRATTRRGACARSIARFSASIYPGDEIVTDIWRNGDVVSFRLNRPGFAGGHLV